MQLLVKQPPAEIQRQPLLERCVRVAGRSHRERVLPRQRRQQRPLKGRIPRRRKPSRARHYDTGIRRAGDAKVPRHVDHCQRGRRQRTEPLVEPSQRRRGRRRQRLDRRIRGICRSADREMNGVRGNRDRPTVLAVIAHKRRDAGSVRRQLPRIERNSHQYGHGRPKPRAPVSGPPHSTYSTLTSCAVPKDVSLRRGGRRHGAAVRPTRRGGFLGRDPLQRHRPGIAMAAAAEVCRTGILCCRPTWRRHRRLFPSTSAGSCSSTIS